MQSILLTGGTGLVGTQLVSMIVAKGDKAIVLTRSLKDKTSSEKVEYALWDAEKNQIDIAAVQKADHIIHLAGAGVVDKKWTAAYKKEIIDSRTKTIELIINTLKNNTNKVKIIVSASATGWYGEDKTPGHFFTEDEPSATDFLGHTCHLWEESVVSARTLGIRVCCLRTGIVLSKKGGALAEFMKPIHLGIAGILGSGTQIISWIHIEDLCRLYLAAIENEQMTGSYNAVAPMPATNSKLTLKLAETLKGKLYIPVHIPAFILKIMMGERSAEVLKSTTVSDAKVKATGFTFLYPSIEAALNELLAK
ncbi:MAG: TIGR01777 family oxidoreductase [Ferruginibacter sp.]